MGSRKDRKAEIGDRKGGNMKARQCFRMPRRCFRVARQYFRPPRQYFRESRQHFRGSRQHFRAAQYSFCKIWGRQEEGLGGLEWRRRVDGEVN